MQVGQKQDVVIIRATNPASVVCAESILVNALTTLGCPLHPEASMAYMETREALPGGTVQRVFQWTLLAAAPDGTRTAKLIEQWNDKAWLVANPTSELAIIKVASENMLRLAERIRLTPHVAVLRKGKKMALIPSHLSPEEQTAAREKLDSAE